MTPDLAKAKSSLSALTADSEAERERAWRAFYAENFGLVYRCIVRSGAPLAEAEDLAQKVFLVAHRRLGENLEIEHPRAWLRGVVLKVVAQNRRKRKLRELRHRVFSLSSAHEEHRTPEHATGAAQAQALVGRILDKMPSKLSEVLVLTELEGMKPSEAAEVLGVPVNTVRSRKRLAKEDFQKHYRRLHPSEGVDD